MNFRGSGVCIGRPTARRVPNSEINPGSAISILSDFSQGKALLPAIIRKQPWVHPMRSSSVMSCWCFWLHFFVRICTRILFFWILKSLNFGRCCIVVLYKRTSQMRCMSKQVTIVANNHDKARCYYSSNQVQIDHEFRLSVFRRDPWTIPGTVNRCTTKEVTSISHLLH